MTLCNTIIICGNKWKIIDVCTNLVLFLVLTLPRRTLFTIWMFLRCPHHPHLLRCRSPSLALPWRIIGTVASLHPVSLPFINIHLQTTMSSLPLTQTPAGLMIWGSDIVIIYPPHRHCPHHLHLVQYHVLHHGCPTCQHYVWGHQWGQSLGSGNKTLCGERRADHFYYRARSASILQQTLSWRHWCPSILRWPNWWVKWGLLLELRDWVVAKEITLSLSLMTMTIIHLPLCQKPWGFYPCPVQPQGTITILYEFWYWNW